MGETSRVRFGPFVLLEGAVIASGAGNGIVAVAIPWLVLERTGNATSAGIVGAATALPLLLSSLFSGAVIDRFGRRRTSIVSDVLSAVSVASIPLVDAAVGLDLPLIVLLAVIGAVFDPAGATARETMLPEVSEETGISLERINGVHEASWGVAYMVGPGVGGVLIALVGATGALWATAAAFLVSIALIALLRIPGVGTPAEADRPRSVLAGAADGLRIVTRDRVLRTMVIVSMVLVGVYLPIEGVILPVVFEQQQAPGRLGAVLMAMSAGAVVGSLSYGAVGARFRRRTLFTGAILGSSLSVLAMSILPPFGVLLAAGALAGLFWGPFGPLVNLSVQTRVGAASRGRALGVMFSAEYAAGPLGYLLAGPAVERFGVEPVFVAFALMLVVTAVVAQFIPALRDLDRAEAVASEVPLSERRPPVTTHLP